MSVVSQSLKFVFVFLISTCSFIGLQMKYVKRSLNQKIATGQTL